MALLISEILTAANNVITAPAMEEVKEPESPTVTITATTPKVEVAEPPKLQIAPRPVMPPEAAAFPRLQKVKITLDKHNNCIFEAERERNQQEIERDDLKGLARLTKKKECDKWDEAYGEKTTPKAETMHEKIQRYQEKADRQNASQPYRIRDKGAR